MSCSWSQKFQVPDDQLNDEKDIDDKDSECTKSNLKPEKTTDAEVIGNTSDAGPVEKQEEGKSDGSDQNEEIEKQHGITYLLIVRVFIGNTNKHCNISTPYPYMKSMYRTIFW